MSYSQAVKGQMTGVSVLQRIHSRAEVELGHQLTDEELSILTDKFTINRAFECTEKVRHFMYHIVSFLF